MEEKYLRFFIAFLSTFLTQNVFHEVYKRTNHYYCDKKIYDAMPVKNSDVIIMRI